MNSTTGRLRLALSSETVLSAAPAEDPPPPPPPKRLGVASDENAADLLFCHTRDHLADRRIGMNAHRFARAEDADRVRGQALFDLISLRLETPQRAAAFLAFVGAGDILMTAITAFHASNPPGR